MKDSEQWVLMRKPTGTTRQKGKRQNPMDKGPTGLVSGMVHQCKFCEKVFTSESSLTNHINNVHEERQNIFRCCKCGRKYNVFNMYIEHLGTHPKNEYRCHECGKQFKDAHLFSLHSPTHLIQCPFCSRTFKDMKLLEDHVNNAHGQALGRGKQEIACSAMWHLKWYMSYRNIVKYIDTSLVKSVLQVLCQM